MRLTAATAGLALLAIAGWPASAAHDGTDRTAPAAAAAQPGVEVSARYASSVLIFKVGEVTLDADFGPRGYRADSFIEAAGLAALFTDFDIRAEVEGRRRGDSVRPDRYGHVERTGDKVRAVDVSFNGGLAHSVAEPPFGSWGVPPASDADRTGVMDPMSAFFALSEQVEADAEAGCSGRLPVFDGKARYDLRLEAAGREEVRTRAWRGEAIVCHAYYEPISGYDPEDRPTPQELRHPLVIWLAAFDEAGIHLPVRLHTRAGFGGVTIEASEISVRRTG